MRYCRSVCVVRLRTEGHGVYFFCYNAILTRKWTKSRQKTNISFTWSLIIFYRSTESKVAIERCWIFRSVARVYRYTFISVRCCSGEIKLQVCKERWKKRLWPVSRCNQYKYVEQLRNTTKNLNEDKNSHAKNRTRTSVIRSRSSNHYTGACGS
jgi:hypothetical protein